METTGTKELTNAPRIGSEFKERVANPKDVIQYHKRKVFAGKSESDEFSLRSDCRNS